MANHQGSQEILVENENSLSETCVLFLLIPLQPCGKTSIFTHALLFTLSKKRKAGDLQAAHDRGESKWKASKHRRCSGQTLQEG